MQHLSPEATPRQAFLEDINRQVGAARAAGGYTAVFKLAQETKFALQREFATLTAGHEVRRMTNQEREALRRTWTPEKIRLNEQIDELHQQIREWEHVEDNSSLHVANEANGWTILDDGTPAKVLANGEVISSYGWVSEFTDSDGTVYKSDGPDEEWKRRHQRYAQGFGDRVRGERLAAARRHADRTGRTRSRTREHRPATTRRTASSSTTSGTDPGDPDGESPAPAILRVRRPSGIVQTFEADHLETDAGLLWATGRWRRRVGLNHSEIRYSDPGTYGFGAGEIVEVRT
jgi:hypothetical protein